MAAVGDGGPSDRSDEPVGEHCERRDDESVCGPVAPVDGDDGATTVHEVGLFLAASEDGLEGVLRIVNRTRQSGHVSIETIDDTGAVFGPVTVWI